LEVFEDEVFEKRRDNRRERRDKFLKIFRSRSFSSIDRFEDLKSD
jgi:hypothetical protein